MENFRKMLWMVIYISVPLTTGLFIAAFYYYGSAKNSVTDDDYNSNMDKTYPLLKVGGIFGGIIIIAFLILWLTYYMDKVNPLGEGQLHPLYQNNLLPEQVEGPIPFYQLQGEVDDIYPHNQVEDQDLHYKLQIEGQYY
jgi:hypothetical protein